MRTLTSGDPNTRRDLTTRSERADHICSANGRWVRIAVVDDDPQMRASLGRLISAEGLSVRLFSSAEEFLESDRYEETTCLILDQSMPGMSGLELQRHLKANNRPVTIIFLSGRDDPRARAEAIKNGAIEFLGKPVRGELLIAAVRSTFASPPPANLPENSNGSTFAQECTRGAAHRKPPDQHRSAVRR